MHVLDQIGGQLTAIQGLLPAAISAAAIFDAERAESQNRCDELSAQVQRQVRARNVADLCPIEFLLIPANTRPDLAVRAVDQVKSDWAEHCRAVDKDPMRYAVETWVTPTAADYIDFWTKLEAAGHTGLVLAREYVVETADA